MAISAYNLISNKIQYSIQPFKKVFVIRKEKNKLCYYSTFVPKEFFLLFRFTLQSIIFFMYIYIFFSKCYFYLAFYVLCMLSNVLIPLFGSHFVHNFLVVSFIVELFIVSFVRFFASFINKLFN